MQAFQLTSSGPPTHVLIATPFGLGGKGGTDRIMDELRLYAQQSNRQDLRISFGSTRGPGRILWSPFYLLTFLLRMFALKLAGRVDVVHINLSGHGSTYRKLLVAGWARRLGIAYVIHLHGSRFRQFWADCTPKTERAIKQMFLSAARIVVLGTVWETLLTDRLASLGEKIVVLPNATPAPTLSHVTDDGQCARIVFLGRLGARKGVPELVEALSLISGHGGWRSILAGDGEIDETRRDVARRGLSDQVSLAGWIGPDEVAELLSRSDILVLASHDENLPMSVIEGMAAGLAIIATPVGAVADIIRHGETGLLIPAGDADALATALRQLIEQPALRRELGANARAFHRAYLNIDQYFDRLSALWIDVNGRTAGKAGDADRTKSGTC